MTAGELKQRLMKFDDNEDVEMKCLIDDNFYKGYIRDVYKQCPTLNQKVTPVTIELQVQQDLTIRQRFDMIGTAIEKAIDRNSTELTNIAYRGR